MTTPDPAKRPRQATMAGWMVVIGSLFSVVTAFEVMGRARSLGTREAIEGFLDDSPGAAMGLDVEGVIQLLQTVATAAAVLAAMAAVLGFYALRGDRRARLGLALLAVPLFVSGLAIGGFLTSLVAAASALLFVSPSREWYDGKAIPVPARDSARPDRPDAGDPSTPPSGPPAPPAGPAGGSPEGGDRPAPYASPYGTATQPRPTAPTGPRPARPPSVSIAVALTLVGSSLVLLLSLVGLIAVLTAPDLMVEEMERTRPDLLEQGLGRDLIVATAIATAVGLLVACLLAIGFAMALLTGRAWGATGLLVVSALTVLFGALAAISSLVAIIPALAAVLVIANLRHRDTRAWLRR